MAPNDPARNVYNLGSAASQLTQLDTQDSSSVDSRSRQAAGRGSFTESVSSAAATLEQVAGLSISSSYQKVSQADSQGFASLAPANTLKLKFGGAGSAGAGVASKAGSQYVPDKLQISASQVDLLQKGSGNEKARALAFADYVENSTVDQLQAIGCLNLGRIAKAIDRSFKSGKLTGSDLSGSRVERVEKKIQTAFIRSYNSTCVDKNSASSVMERAAYLLFQEAVKERLGLDCDVNSMWLHSSMFYKTMPQPLHTDSLRLAQESAGEMLGKVIHFDQFAITSGRAWNSDDVAKWASVKSSSLEQVSLPVHD